EGLANFGSNACRTRELCTYIFPIRLSSWSLSCFICRFSFALHNGGVPPLPPGQRYPAGGHPPAPEARWPLAGCLRRSLPSLSYHARLRRPVLGRGARQAQRPPQDPLLPRGVRWLLAVHSFMRVCG